MRRSAARCSAADGGGGGYLTPAIMVLREEYSNDWSAVPVRCGALFGLNRGSTWVQVWLMCSMGITMTVERNPIWTR